MGCINAVPVCASKRWRQREETETKESAESFWELVRVRLRSRALMPDGAVSTKLVDFKWSQSLVSFFFFFLFCSAIIDRVLWLCMENAWHSRGDGRLKAKNAAKKKKWVIHGNRHFAGEALAIFNFKFFDCFNSNSHSQVLPGFLLKCRCQDMSIVTVSYGVHGTPVECRANP